MEINKQAKVGRLYTCSTSVKCSISLNNLRKMYLLSSALLRKGITTFTRTSEAPVSPKKAVAQTSSTHRQTQTYKLSSPYLSQFLSPLFPWPPLGAGVGGRLTSPCSNALKKQETSFLPNTFFVLPSQHSLLLTGT